MSDVDGARARIWAYLEDLHIEDPPTDADLRVVLNELDRLEKEPGRMSETKPKPAHKQFRLDPPHNERFIYWVAVGRIPGDSRTEHIRADRKWFWKEQDA